MATPGSASSLGEIIRRQRELSRLSMRQFAELSGISNPYLSQIERGLREPSERVLDAIASSLQTTVDALYEQAGVRPDAVAEVPDVLVAIAVDPDLSPSQRRALREVYEAFISSGDGPRRRRRARSAAEAD